MKTLLLTLFAPRFWRDMPRDDRFTRQQHYTAEAYTFSPFTRTGKWSGIFRSRRKAYIEARWAALKVDWSTDDCGGMLGVGWRVSATSLQDDCARAALAASAK